MNDIVTKLTEEEKLKKLEEYRTIAKNQLSDNENPDYIEKEKKSLKEVLNTHHIPDTHIDKVFSVYLELLLICKAASKLEMRDNSEHDQLNNARGNAAKLAILFGSTEKALEYIKRYIKDSDDKFMHDACLFSLPDSDWNMDFWRKFISYKNVSNPKDPAMRLLPLFNKIDEYINKNGEALIEAHKEKIKNEVIAEFQNKFVNEYDLLMNQTTLDKEKDIKAIMEKQNQLMAKEARRRIQGYLKTELKIPVNADLNPDQRAQLDHREKNLTVDDLKIIENLKKEIAEEFYKKASQTYERSHPKKKFTTKEEYLKRKMEKSTDVIDNIAKDKAKAMVLTVNTPISTLINYAKNNVYKNAHKNPEAAELFFNWQMSEKRFDHYLSLKPQDDNLALPNLKIDGADIFAKYDRYYLMKLDSKDPRAAILGKMTSCCQSLGQEGEEPAIHGITHPKSCFYVICEKNTATEYEPDKIVAQCWAWRGKRGELVFDSIESHIDFRGENCLLIKVPDTYILSPDEFRKISSNENNMPILIKQGEKFIIWGNHDGKFELTVLKDKGEIFKKIEFPKENFQAIKKILPPNIEKNILDQKGHDDFVGVNIQMISDFYTYFAHKLVEYPDIISVNVGTSGETPDGLGVLTPASLADPIDYYGYRDSKKQRLIATSGISLIEKYIKANPASKLNPDFFKSTKKITRAEFSEYCNLVAINKDDQLKEYIIQRLIADGCQLEEITSRISLVESWLKLRKESSKITKDQILDFIAKGGDININADRLSLFAGYALQKKWDLIPFLLEQGAILDSTDNNPRDSLNILKMAINDSQWSVVRSLLKFNCKFSNEHLLDLTKHSQWEILLDIINDPKYSLSDENLLALLPSVTRAGQIALLETILKRTNYDVNSLDKEGYHLLYYATSSPKNLKTIQYLLDHGASIDIQTSHSSTALLKALQEIDKHNPYTGDCDYLIERGANVNIILNDNQNILMNLATSDYRLAAMKFLLNKGANIHYKDPKGFSALSLAGKSNSWECVTMLISAGANVNDKDDNGNCLFHHIAKPRYDIGPMTLIKTLIDKGLDINTKNNDNETPILLAAREHRWPIVKEFLLHNADPNVKTRDDKSLMKLLLNDFFPNKNDMIKLCLSNGYKPNDVEKAAILCNMVSYASLEEFKKFINEWQISLNHEGLANTLLHAATRHGRADLARFLLSQGADVNNKNESGESPIFSTYSKEMLDLFFSHGAFIDEQDNDGYTPLHRMIYNENLDTAQHLISNGANINTSNKKGVTLLMDAVKKHNGKKFFDFIIKFNPDVTAKDNNGETALHHAVYNNETEYFSSLLERKANWNVKDNSGRTPLHVAAGFPSMSVFSWLLSNKQSCELDLNAKDNSGRTPLHVLCSYNSRDKVKIKPFLQLGNVDINARDNEGETPLLQAVRMNMDINGGSYLIKVLIANKADVTIKNKKFESVIELAKLNKFPKEIIDLLETAEKEQSLGKTSPTFFQKQTAHPSEEAPPTRKPEL